jgi:hypothetical protein
MIESTNLSMINSPVYIAIVLALVRILLGQLHAHERAAFASYRSNKLCCPVHSARNVDEVTNLNFTSAAHLAGSTTSQSLERRFPRNRSGSREVWRAGGVYATN